jgi:hypothetical protein
MMPMDIQTDELEATESDSWQRLAILLASRLAIRTDLDDSDLGVLRDFFVELLQRRTP